jgi:DNA-binding NarL/FixJ family response regulator
MQPAIRVLLVDDQQLVRKGLQLILTPADGFEIIAEAEDGAAALQLADRLRPDVVLMDIRMKGMDGVQATRRLRARGESPPILILTTFDDDEVLSASLRAGAAGFILKDAPSEDIIRATRVVAEGGAWLDPSITGRVLAAYRAGGQSSSSPETQRLLAGLTARELEVLRLIGRGLSNDEVAQRLVIGEATVKSHVGHILDKLRLRDRSAAIVFAFDHGLVQPGA